MYYHSLHYFCPSRTIWQGVHSSPTVDRNFSAASQCYKPTQRNVIRREYREKSNLKEDAVVSRPLGARNDSVEALARLVRYFCSLFQKGLNSPIELKVILLEHDVMG